MIYVAAFVLFLQLVKMSLTFSENDLLILILGASFHRCSWWPSFCLQSSHLCQVLWENQLPVWILVLICFLQDWAHLQVTWWIKIPGKVYTDEILLCSLSSPRDNYWGKESYILLTISKWKHFQLISTRGVISCSPFLSGKAKGFLIFSCIVLFQTLFFGILQFLYYFR